MELSMETVTSWINAVKFADDGEYEKSLETFKQISVKSSKIFYNMGCICLLLRDLSLATEYFSQALNKDSRLVVALFQRANIFYLQNRFSECQNDLTMALNFLPNAGFINYHSGQFGLRVKISTCQVLHNLSLCYWYNDNMYNKAQSALQQAKDCTCKVHGQHTFIDDALAALKLKSKNVKPICISCDRLYSPARTVICSTKDIDYLKRDKTKIIAAQSTVDRITGFMGPHMCSMTPTLAGRRGLPVNCSETIRSRTPPSVGLKPPPRPRTPSPYRLENNFIDDYEKRTNAVSAMNSEVERSTNSSPVGIKPQQMTSLIPNHQKNNVAISWRNDDSNETFDDSEAVRMWTRPPVRPKPVTHVSSVGSLAATFESKNLSLTKVNRTVDEKSSDQKGLRKSNDLFSGLQKSSGTVDRYNLSSPPSRIPPRAPIHARKS